MNSTIESPVHIKGPGYVATSAVDLNGNVLCPECKGQGTQGGELCGACDGVRWLESEPIKKPAASDLSAAPCSSPAAKVTWAWWMWNNTELTWRRCHGAADFPSEEVARAYPLVWNQDDVPHLMREVTNHFSA